MKKLLLYPFTKELCPIIRHRSTLTEYELTSAVPAKGFGWENKDACVADGGCATGFILKESLEDEIEKCDAVFEDITPRKAVALEDSEHLNPDLKLWEAPVPVIMVAGQGQNCQKFDIQLGLRNAFKRDGYKILQFGSSVYSGLFGFDTIPSAPDASLWKKIFLFNAFFKAAYEREKPDVIIIGVAGGIMPLNSRVYEKFGETALALAHAAPPDIAVISYYYTMPTDEYFDILRQYARFRLGAGNVIFHAANTRFIDNRDLNEQSYLTMDSAFVLDELNRNKELTTRPFNALVDESAQRVYRGVIEQLTDNICVL